MYDQAQTELVALHRNRHSSYKTANKQKIGKKKKHASYGRKA